MKAASEDIPNRRPVWEALSEGFLVDEIPTAELQRLGQTLAASPYTVDEIEEILYDEVYPACIWNVISLTAAWPFFESAWLQAEIMNKRQSRFTLPRFLKVWTIPGQWREIKAAFLECRRTTSTAGAEEDAGRDYGRAT
jgi:hypothetical protein